MQHHMLTAKGVSEEYNQHTREDPMYGFGQGATDAAAKWTLQDNIIAKAYNKRQKDVGYMIQQR
eukprot:6079591-Ditylum_brightwellii.AAC.2